MHGSLHYGQRSEQPSKQNAYPVWKRDTSGDTQRPRRNDGTQPRGDGPSARRARARASSPPTRATGRSRSASTRSGSSRPRTTGAPTATCSSPPRARADHISGVILYDETIRQPALDGTPFPKLLESQGVIPGIKVDKGAKDAGERARREDHRGARRAARAAGGVRLARRALHQVARRDHDRRRHSQRVLPVDERPRARPLRRAQPGGRARPDRRARGADGRRPLDRASFDVTSRTLHAVFTELRDQRVHFEQMLLKPNMVLSGYDASDAGGRPGGRRADASAASAGTSRRRCRGSSSSPAARPTRTRPRT